jgi:hypothetical protein
VSQTSRSNVRPVKGGWSSPNAPERASSLRLTLRAQSRSETGTAPFKTARRDISLTQEMTNGNQDVTEDGPCEPAPVRNQPRRFSHSQDLIRRHVLKFLRDARGPFGARRVERGGVSEAEVSEQTVLEMMGAIPEVAGSSRAVTWFGLRADRSPGSTALFAPALPRPRASAASRSRPFRRG